MSEKMNPEIKAKWLTALRSGEYEQGTGKLRTEGSDGVIKHCCLGVLCEIAVKEGVIERAGVYYGSFSSGTGSTVVLPYAAQKWAGLDEENPSLDLGRRLSTMNDVLRLPFTEIADAIEEHL